MASRCEIVDKEYIEEWGDKSENENTKKSMDYWKNVFKKKGNDIRNFQANLEEYETCPRPNILYIFRTSLIFPSVLLTSNWNGSS